MLSHIINFEVLLLAFGYTESNKEDLIWKCSTGWLLKHGSKLYYKDTIDVFEIAGYTRKNFLEDLAYIFECAARKS